MLHVSFSKSFVVQLITSVYLRKPISNIVWRASHIPAVSRRARRRATSAAGTEHNFNIRKSIAEKKCDLDLVSPPRKVLKEQVRKVFRVFPREHDAGCEAHHTNASALHARRMKPGLHYLLMDQSTHANTVFRALSSDRDNTTCVKLGQSSPRP